jgi:hypothetical protein
MRWSIGSRARGCSRSTDLVQSETIENEDSHCERVSSQNLPGNQKSSSNTTPPFRLELADQMTIWIENKRLPWCLVTHDSSLKSSRVSCFCVSRYRLPSAESGVLSASDFNGGISSFLLLLGSILERQVNRDYIYSGIYAATRIGHIAQSLVQASASST